MNYEEYLVDESEDDMTIQTHPTPDTTTSGILMHASYDMRFPFPHTRKYGKAWITTSDIGDDIIYAAKLIWYDDSFDRYHGLDEYRRITIYNGEDGDTILDSLEDLSSGWQTIQLTRESINLINKTDKTEIRFFTGTNGENWSGGYYRSWLVRSWDYLTGMGSAGAFSPKLEIAHGAKGKIRTSIFG
jgi:hypothetical protein